MWYAELGMGTYLGGLPSGYRLDVIYRGKIVRAYKRDIGLGGASVHGVRRDIDLHTWLAKALNFEGVDVVRVTHNRCY